MKSWFSRKDRIAGLDIGSRLIKLVEITETSKGAALSLYEQIPLEKGIIEDGLVQDERGLARAVSELFRKARCRARLVAAALPGTAVVVKKAMFQKMEEDELRILLTDEGEKYLPFETVENVNFDFFILGESPFNPNQMDVIIVAARKEIVEGYVAAIEQGKRRVAVLDVDAFALETAYERNYDFEPSDVDALVHIGASITTVNVLRGGVSSFTRSFPMGGISVTGESAEGEEASGGGVDVKNAEPLLGEIERSLDYYSSTAMDPHIRQVLLSGGAAGLSGIRESLAGRLHTAVAFFDPFQRIICDPKHFPPPYLDEIRLFAAPGVGLALRRMDDR
jgi:type IV pilus assembly protein PilM